MMPLLSILIPSLYKRKEFLTRLFSQLYSQNDALLLNKCEILINIDGGQKSIGNKRNELKSAATGKYISYIDDDDSITTDYLSEIFIGIEKDVDHIGISGFYAPNNGPTERFKCSKDYVFGKQNDIYLRNPQHLCPIRSEIARHISYPDISFGEDKVYSDQLKSLGLIKTEHLIEKEIYIYEYRHNKTI